MGAWRVFWLGAAAGGALMLAACGSDTEERAASGGLSGAAAGALVGGPVGAAVGAAVGAGAGTVVEKSVEEKNAEEQPNTTTKPPQ